MKELIIKVDEEKMDIEGNAPVVDGPQELVRCKDCKHSTVSENGLIKCGHTFRTANFFCADGEKRD